jgi:hypothetical protein
VNLTGTVKSDARNATLSASAPKEEKEEIMFEGTETGDQKEPASSESMSDMVGDAQEAFFSVEDFIIGAIEYLKSFLPAQP